MKKTGLLLVVFMLSIFTQALSAQEINFTNKKWSKVLMMAKKQNKLIFVDVSADWCGPCKQMEKNTFKNVDVINFFNENFINVRLMDDSEELDEFGITYEYDAFPTMFYINHKGEVVKKIVGGQDAEELLTASDYAIHPEKSPINIAKAKLKSGNYEKEDLYDYILAAFQEDGDYSKEVEEYLSYYNPEDINEESVFIVFYLSEKDIYSPFSKYFSKNYVELNSTYSDYAEEKMISMVSDHVEKYVASNNQSGLDDVVAFGSTAFEREVLVEFIDMVKE